MRTLMGTKTGITMLTLVVLMAGISCSKQASYRDALLIDTLPAIFPDYTNITIPVNIAPLNFQLSSNYTNTALTITAGSTHYNYEFSSNQCCFNQSKWQKLLAQHVNDTLVFTLYAKTTEGKWVKFLPFTMVVSADVIDSWLAFRQINTGYILWEKMGIYQRHLESFNQQPIIENNSLNSACMNCHAFKQNNPNTMMLHIRNAHGGTILQMDGQLKKIDTKTPSTLSAGVYPAWHPQGTHIAFSVNKIGQQFHAINNPRITVSDDCSDIIVYDIAKNMVTTSPQMATLWRENLPTWSPNGQYLYFISAPPRKDKMAPIDVVEQYSLLRIAFNANTNTFGKVDTLIKADSVNASITFPKVSPCGKFVAFTLIPSGYFSIHRQQADIYLLNLETRQITKPDINSPNTDSYHSWNSTGKWMVFSSKQLGGLFTRPFFTHFTADGTFTKPFVMPQSDPDFYNSFLLNYNVPEFITGKVSSSPTRWRDAIWSDALPVNFDSRVDVNALSGATTLSHK